MAIYSSRSTKFNQIQHKTWAYSREETNSIRVRSIKPRKSQEISLAELNVENVEKIICWKFIKIRIDKKPKQRIHKYFKKIEVNKSPKISGNRRVNKEKKKSRIIKNKDIIEIKAAIWENEKWKESKRRCYSKIKSWK